MVALLGALCARPSVEPEINLEKQVAAVLVEGVGGDSPRILMWGACVATVRCTWQRSRPVATGYEGRCALGSVAGWCAVVACREGRRMWEESKLLVLQRSFCGNGV